MNRLYTPRAILLTVFYPLPSYSSRRRSLLVAVACTASLAGLAADMGRAGSLRLLRLCFEYGDGLRT